MSEKKERRLYFIHKHFKGKFYRRLCPEAYVYESVEDFNTSNISRIVVTYAPLYGCMSDNHLFMRNVETFYESSKAIATRKDNLTKQKERFKEVKYPSELDPKTAEFIKDNRLLYNSNLWNNTGKDTLKLMRERFGHFILAGELDKLLSSYERYIFYLDAETDEIYIGIKSGTSLSLVNIKNYVIPINEAFKIITEATVEGCMRRRYNAIIVDPSSYKFISIGQNKSDCSKDGICHKELQGDNEHNKNYDNCLNVLHAEEEAIKNCLDNRIIPKGHILYLKGENVKDDSDTNFVPCNRCCHIINTVGIKDVYVNKGDDYVRYDIEL